jgi:tRNA 2-thiouridine synthesizing protein A
VAVQFDQEIDCSGLACPMPVVRTKRAIDSMQVGQVLKMTATDPGSVSDLTAWAASTGHELLTHEQAGNKYIFFVRKTK